MVITQFSISIILIVATIVLNSQLHFMQNQELGFRKDHMLVIDFQTDDKITSHEETIIASLGISNAIGLTDIVAREFIPWKFWKWIRLKRTVVDVNYLDKTEQSCSQSNILFLIKLFK